ncbi:g8507 [Coccomyxa viridis]|uniref:G8507 protein n=1 Tax=Coccomyxa viridis TaxID=1274662 RepID=A0ABP1G0I4_9CHLO
MVGALPAPLSDVSEAHRDDLRAKGSQKSDHGEEAVPEDSLRLARRPVTRGSKRKAGLSEAAPRHAKKPVKLPAGATDLEILEHAALDMPIIQAIRVSETPLKLLRDGAYYLKEAYRAFLRVARERPGFDLPRPWARKHPRSQEYLTALLQFSRTVSQYVKDRDRNIAQGQQPRILPPVNNVDACMKALWVYVCCC